MGLYCYGSNIVNATSSQGFPTRCRDGFSAVFRDGIPVTPNRPEAGQTNPAHAPIQRNADARHGAIRQDEGSAQGCDSLLPHGGFLRDLRRRRQTGLARPGHHADRPQLWHRRRGENAAGRRALSRRGEVHRRTRGLGIQGGGLRAGRRSEKGPRRGQAGCGGGRYAGDDDAGADPRSRREQLHGGPRIRRGRIRPSLSRSFHRRVSCGGTERGRPAQRTEPPRSRRSDRVLRPGGTGSGPAGIPVPRHGDQPPGGVGVFI